MKPSAKAIIFYGGKFLFFLRDNKESIPDPNTWSLVGGEIEVGESPEQAIDREMNEEINISPKDTKYLGKITTPDGNFHAIFLSKPTSAEVNSIKLGDEGQKVEFFRFDEIEKLELARNVKTYFDRYGSYLNEILNTNTTIDPKRLGLT